MGSIKIFFKMSPKRRICRENKNILQNVSCYGKYLRITMFTVVDFLKLSMFINVFLT